MSNSPINKTSAAILRPMLARKSDEGHRAATPLELLFDLVSVIAIAAAAGGLHHAIAANHTGEGLIGYGMSFAMIWWAWMHFTWFANSYDNDDVFYRIAVLTMMTGSLIMAAGIKAVFVGGGFLFGIIGYIVMRLAHIALLIRAASHNPELQKSNHAMALGIGILQIGWIIGYLYVPSDTFILFFIPMFLAEISVPALVSKYGEIPWHKHHIAERYGLLTIIVLGESLFALSGAMGILTKHPEIQYEMILQMISGLVTLFAMWWIYFGEDNHHALGSVSTLYLWGYTHLFIFAAIAAFGAGLGVNFDFLTEHAKIGIVGARASLAVPAAIFLICIWLVHDRFNATHMLHHIVLPVIAIAILFGVYIDGFNYLMPMLVILAAMTSSHTRQRHLHQSQNATE